MTEPETAAPVKRDGFAVASLITGVLGFFGITAVLGVGFGTVALVRIHRTGGRGRGLAIGGIVAGVLWGIALPLAAIVLLANFVSATNAPIAAMEVDTCYTTARPGRDAVKVSCDDEHDGYVVDAFAMAGPQTPYPGVREATDAAFRSCQDRTAGLFAGEGIKLPPEAVIVGYAPDKEAWEAGARNAACGLQGRPRR